MLLFHFLVLFLWPGGDITLPVRSLKCRCCVVSSLFELSAAGFSAPLWVECGWSEGAVFPPPAYLEMVGSWAVVDLCCSFTRAFTQVHNCTGIYPSTLTLLILFDRSAHLPHYNIYVIIVPRKLIPRIESAI